MCVDKVQEPVKSHQKKKIHEKLMSGNERFFEFNRKLVMKAVSICNWR
jgi:hypothetical protein